MPISYASERSFIRRTLIDPPPANSRTAEVCGGFSWSKDCMATRTRTDAVLLARLRAGHTPLVKAYATLLTPPRSPCVRFVKRIHSQLNTGYGGAQGSLQLDRTSLEVLPRSSRPLPPTMKGYWRSQGSPSGRFLALKPELQKEQQ